MGQRGLCRFTTSPKDLVFFFAVIWKRGISLRPSGKGAPLGPDE